MTQTPICPHCHDDRQVEPIQDSGRWYCNTCSKVFQPHDHWISDEAYRRAIDPEDDREL